MTDATTTVVSSDPAVKASLEATPTETPQTPTEVEVKLGDKTVKVAPEVAEALAAAKKAAEDAGASTKALTDQMAALQQQIDAGKPKPKAKDEHGLDVLLFTDPDKAVQMITENILKQVDEKNRQTTAQAQFWSEFYKQNKDLQDYDEYVKFVFQREFPTMTGKKMTVEASIKHLGESAKADLLKMRGGKPGNSKPVAEGGSEGNRSAETKSDVVSEDSRTTTASILAERAAARRAAKSPGRKSK